MKKNSKSLTVFLDKYQQNISKGKRSQPLKRFGISIILTMLIITVSLMVNAWSSKSPQNNIPRKTNVVFDDYPVKAAKTNPATKEADKVKPPEKKSKNKKNILYTQSKKNKKTKENIFVKNIIQKVSIKKGFIKTNDSLWGILSSNGLNTTLITKVVSASRGKYNFKNLRNGQAYKLKFNKDNKLDEFSIETKNENIVKVALNYSNNKINVTKEPVKYNIIEKNINGKIKSSLFEAIIKSGEKSSLASRLAAIYEWQIDFLLDIRKGDEFNVLVEKKYKDGKFARYGKILASEFINNKKKHTAFLYKETKGVEGYFDSKGVSLKKQFLKSPLKYTRISSGFTRKRYHPILKRYMPHLGIDYAAPTGTPVRSVGDGKVIWAKWKGPNGNLVMIKHNSIYKTSYAHLHKIAKKIKTGTYVKQGQIIGFVGSTGRSTGPHLDFHIKKYGKDINPLKLKIPSAKSLRKKEKSRFFKARNTLLSRLRRSSAHTLVADKK